MLFATFDLMTCDRARDQSETANQQDQHDHRVEQSGRLKINVHIRDYTRKDEERSCCRREGHLPRLGFTISRADVADFMLKVVENRSSIGKIVGVCN